MIGALRVLCSRVVVAVVEVIVGVFAVVVVLVVAAEMDAVAVAGRGCVAWGWSMNYRVVGMMGSTVVAVVVDG